MRWCPGEVRDVVGVFLEPFKPSVRWNRDWRLDRFHQLWVRIRARFRTSWKLRDEGKCNCVCLHLYFIHTFYCKWFHFNRIVDFHYWCFILKRVLLLWNWVMRILEELSAVLQLGQVSSSQPIPSSSAVSKEVLCFLLNFKLCQKKKKRFYSRLCYCAGWYRWFLQVSCRKPCVPVDASRA